MGKSLEVTPKNIEHIPLDMLTKRYHTITKTIRKKLDVFTHDELGASFVRLRNEAELIRTYLKERNLEELIAEQMTFPGMEKPKRATYVRVVEYELFKHYTRLKRIKELQTKLNEGIEIVIPSSSCVSQYGGVGGGRSSYQSISERVVIQADNLQRSYEIELEDKLLLIQPMERALRQLDYRQRLLVEEKYFHDEEQPDKEVMDKMPFAKTLFYEVKNGALLKLAEALNLL